MTNVQKNSKGEVTSVELDEKILPGDPRHGVHNPEVGQRDALSVHDAEPVVEAVQVDLPESDLPERPPLVRELTDEQVEATQVQPVVEDKPAKKKADKSDDSDSQND